MELNEKLARRFGVPTTTLQCVRIGAEGSTLTLYPGEYIDKLGHAVSWQEAAPDFTHSFDACFKWLVPELYKRDFWFEMLGDGVVGYDFRIMERASNKVVSMYQAKTPSLALCLAIEKLIDAEGE